ncbi:MAG: Aspartyl/glutamyl-tRNA(Asn/Gln) amidotransferase subunit B [candidate division WWE3 bacterium GW2011_GWA1_41_8]|uniref:Aspartyl/glutamyl-tRNA(Asn/Gln) amidotransferase subunit B n=3 Tax=Katanobacteria TaxID=422282 RepID=A0A0G0XBL1_UNCKA|nr:MAG: Aspartyl/glutamyl-tRNA(Asn/Gln) amidotransferase subunit B [candidate division WWE3 bacterium GW2011_GWB1_41_6]KKS22354.1 MAG: Aspartyl/glutamyl-tRNA(Asn/Gln) amidotransferase subunit B [candidate division WWE3 bacterium GW2011_GWA1_41_8]OGC58266.1 MAG: hypothetical protein A2976_04175 [candidate division WWE3 bacterium RIFCSPLOWO2_01_FULL_41_9]
MTERELLGEYKLVLGMEIHLHLKTKTKMFCRDSADIYEAEPNTHVCPVCLGLPGALPVPNKDAVRMTQLLGLAVKSSLNKDSRFDRKHYFYPDLPKGYQISQYKQPLCVGGFLKLDSGTTIEIERIHLEEDTAKSFHELGNTLIDFNKSDMPLAEIVTGPSFRNIADAVEFSKKIQDIARYLGISDVDMEKGQMRLEANISIRTAEMEEKGILPSYKVEIKNINSFRFMEKAVRAEIVRQKKLLDKGEAPVQENRGFDENSGKTVSQREKEEAHDYRYFPEPDIPPMHFDENYVADIKSSLTELPDERKARLVDEMGLNKQVAAFLSSGTNINIYEKFADLTDNKHDPVKIGNLLMNRKELWSMEVSDIESIIKTSEDKITDEDSIKSVVEKVLADNPDAVEAVKAGKTATFEFLVGQVMRETSGKADSTIARKLITDLIGR